MASDTDESSEEEISSEEETGSEEETDSEEAPESSAEDSDADVVVVQDPSSDAEDSEAEFDLIYKFDSIDEAKKRRYSLVTSKVSTAYNILYSGDDGDLESLYTEGGDELCRLDTEHDYYTFYSSSYGRKLIVVIQDEPTFIGDGDPNNGNQQYISGEGNG